MFAAFPMEVLALKKLKKVLSKDNRKQVEYYQTHQTFEIPQEAKDALPLCEFITD